MEGDCGRWRAVSRTPTPAPVAESRIRSEPLFTTQKHARGVELPGPRQDWISPFDLLRSQRPSLSYAFSLSAVLHLHFVFCAIIIRQSIIPSKEEVVCECGLYGLYGVYV